jgi:hypothetical protein
MASGLDCEGSKRIIGEGMTLFCNLVPAEVLKEENGKGEYGMKDTCEPESSSS